MDRATKSRTSEYRSWSAMKTRCFNRVSKGYKHYGGRGITVCARWMKFENFLADMGKRPARKSLDRINNDGNYEPGNCRWATALQQSINKQNSRWLTIDGIRLRVEEWAQKYGFSARNACAAARKRGMTHDEFVTRKVRAKRAGQVGFYPAGEYHPNARFTEGQIAKMRSLMERGWTTGQVAKIYHTGRKYMWKVKLRLTRIENHDGMK